MIRTQVVMQVTGSCCKYRRSFTRLPAAHLLLCSPVPNRPQIHTSPWPGVRDPCYKSSQPQPSKSPCFQNLILNGKKKKRYWYNLYSPKSLWLTQGFHLKSKVWEALFLQPCSWGNGSLKCNVCRRERWRESSGGDETGGVVGEALTTWLHPLKSRMTS